MEIIISGFSGNSKDGLLFRHLTTNYPLNGAFHRHEGYEVYLFLQGNVNCYVEQQCFHMERGDLFVIRPGQYHRPAMLDQRDYERITLNFPDSLLRHFSTETSDLTAAFQSPSVDKVCFVHLSEVQVQEYLSLITNIKHQIGSGAFGSDLMVQSCLTQLFVMINRAFCTTEKPAEKSTPNIMPGLIRELLRYIDSNLSEKITLESLEHEFYLSGTYISRQFKKHTGLTLREYLLERRISHARALLSSDLSITEVCQQSGFSDYANFIRSFTKIVGVSPGKYAKQQKELMQK